MSANVKIKYVYVINEGGDGKNRWTKVGVAFLNKDGSLNVVLDVLPLTGKLHIRDRQEIEEKQAA